MAGWEATEAGLGPTPSTFYTVPAGRNLLITDIVVGGDATISGRFNVYTAGGNGCASIGVRRLRNVTIPSNDSIVIPLTTGIGFASGQTICMVGFEGGSISVNMRGFLFTPS
jgi:hypothetical protein